MTGYGLSATACQATEDLSTTPCQTVMDLAQIACQAGRIIYIYMAMCHLTRTLWGKTIEGYNIDGLARPGLARPGQATAMLYPATCYVVPWGPNFPPSYFQCTSEMAHGHICIHIHLFSVLPKGARASSLLNGRRLRRLRLRDPPS